MASKLTWSQAVTFMGGDSNRLTQYLKGDNATTHPVFDQSLQIADSLIRSRIISRYTQASYDALDSTSMPAYVQHQIFSLTLGIATAHDEGRPQAILDGVAAVWAWLNDIESGKAQIPELTPILTAQTNSNGGSTVRVGAPAVIPPGASITTVANVFDVTNLLKKEIAI